MAAGAAGVLAGLPRVHFSVLPQLCFPQLWFTNSIGICVQKDCWGRMGKNEVTSKNVMVFMSMCCTPGTWYCKDASLRPSVPWCSTMGVAFSGKATDQTEQRPRPLALPSQKLNGTFQRTFFAAAGSEREPSDYCSSRLCGSTRLCVSSCASRPLPSTAYYTCKSSTL